MGNNSKNPVGYIASSLNPVGKGKSVPNLASNDKADAKARGNITLASEQKGILTREKSNYAENSAHKIKY